MNNKIRAAVLPVVSVCVPDLYTGEKTTYCTFQYTEMPQAFGDDMPQITVYLVQVHLFAPCGENVLPLRKQRAQRAALCWIYRTAGGKCIR